METNATTMPASGGIDQVAAALVAAQAELTNPEKSKTVSTGKYSYSYADLADVISVVRPVFARHGLAILHLMGQAASGSYVLSAKILHKSGQSLDSVYPVPDGLGAQELGSWMTYMRRYSVCNLAFMAGETDEDGAAAQAGQKDAEAEAKRAKAAEALEKAKAAGRMKSAHDGHVIKPGEGPAPLPPEEPKRNPDPGPAGPSTVMLIPNKLSKAMQADGITPPMLHDYYVKSGHFPEQVQPCDLDDEYIALLLENWTKAVKAMKGAK